MLSLTRAWNSVTVKAEPLPDVWSNLKDKNIRLRRGQLNMVAAAPNAGKSMFALIYAIRAKRPTLFFSADTDTATVMLRAASHLSGHGQQTVESNLESYPSYYDKFLGDMSNIQWVFDSSPSLDDIEMELKAYQELYGISPELIIVDNLMNVAAETDNEWAGLRAIMMELHDLARKTEACVLVLHHVSEASEYGTGSMPPPRRSIHGKVAQLPSLILTLGYDSWNKLLKVAVVKNRYGAHSPDGSLSTDLVADYATCQIYDKDMNGITYETRAYKD